MNKAIELYKRKNNLTEKNDTRNFKLLNLFLREKSFNTKKAYQTDLIQFFDFINNTFVGEIDLELLQDYRDFLFQNYCNAETDEEKRNAIINGNTATIARKLSAVKSLFSFAKKIGFINIDTASALSTVKVRENNNIVVLKEEEIFQMLNHIQNRDYRYKNLKQRDYVLIRLLYATAARISELVELKFKNITKHKNEENGVVSIFGKGQKERFMKISKKTYNEVKKLQELLSKNKEDYVFSTRQSNKMTRQQAFNIVRKIAKECDIDKTTSPHLFRHSHISHAIKKGADLAVVRDSAGHASIQTTNRYIKSDPDISSSDYLSV